MCEYSSHVLGAIRNLMIPWQTVAQMMHSGSLIILRLSASLVVRGCRWRNGAAVVAPSEIADENCAQLCGAFVRVKAIPAAIIAAASGHPDKSKCANKWTETSHRQQTGFIIKST